jgi:TIR domain-containing protein
MPSVSHSISYDLFLSYNSADHTLIEEIAQKIRDEHLEPFLDRWYLAPGSRWRMLRLFTLVRYRPILNNVERCRDPVLRVVGDNG